MSAFEMKLAALICAVCISIGQVIMKLAAVSMNDAGDAITMKTVLLVGAGFGLYGLTSIGWLVLLRYAELGKVYPFVALAFVLVPLASAFIFGEQFSTRYIIGSVLLIAGVLLCSN